MEMASSSESSLRQSLGVRVVLLGAGLLVLAYVLLVVLAYAHVRGYRPEIFVPGLEFIREHTIGVATTFVVAAAGVFSVVVGTLLDPD